MAHELAEFQDIIEQLKPAVEEPDFNQIVAETAKGLSRPLQHILKLELKRLARPCSLVIDMRKQGFEHCQPIECNGTIHYLTESIADVFERQLRSFSDYTIGVNEAVNDAIELLQYQTSSEASDSIESSFDQSDYYEEEDAPLDTYIVPAFEFSQTGQRCEERMNYIVRIEMQTGPKILKGNSVDISISGLKVKTVTEHQFIEGEKFAVFFRGLESEYSLDRKNGIRYEVVKAEKVAHEMHVSLKRDINTPNNQFDEFLRRFIQGNKRRYKVNIDNTLEAIRSKSYEQYYVPYFSSVPVFVETLGSKMQCHYVLTNDNNKDNVYYWVDDSNQIVLNQALTDKRLQQLLYHPLQEMYLYCFNHYQGGRVSFYSATNLEIRQKKPLQDIFFAFGSRKASWRVFKVQMTAIDPQQCYRPLSLPDSVGESVREQNSPPRPKLISALQKVTHMVLITNISDSVSNQAYQRRTIVNKHLPALKVFAHKRDEQVAPVALYRFKYQNLRSETRYQLRTRVEITLQNKTLKGITEDVSPSGMSIELEGQFTGENFAVVQLSFPELQRMTRQIPLKELPYEVRNVSKTKNIINLKIHQESESIAHPAKLFFTNLLKSNKNRLKSDAENEGIEGMGEALRNIYCSNVLNIGYYIIKESGSLLPHAMTQPPMQNRLNNLFSYDVDKENYLNIYPLFAAEGEYSRRFYDLLRGLSAKSAPVVEELFIAFEPDAGDSEDAIRAHFVDQFNDDHARRLFIVEAMSVGVFYGIKVFLSKTGRPDQDILRTELSYVSVYAAHKAKALEEELWSITGAGDIIDVTDEMLRRYGFTDNHIEQNQKKDKQILLTDSP